ncbi:glycosyltransferase family 2 protein [Myceligenerans pegani]|uniref:Glycosyltransferase family 2 protein n=1 Tax=Myceligenerans pegani TaxID=2776917 RepID=A0ABR9MTU3_9MICO|nr:glycosyltransferase family 2 protein [Myceligenerans sp. TRM 65318]MBE1874784.1 glycosyltransferase family 2 protein [Myceligenerans sp. TRM 65318]MBE3017055.1 glycosyltransferase family 2 protein [Myceligenerans sp. TRM 65318]
MPTAPATAVVVVNYGSVQLASAALRPFAGTPWTRVLVDSWSSAAERDRVVAAGAADDWTLVLPDTNLGFGGGADAGVRAARDAGCDVVLVLNPDAVIDLAAAEALAADVAADPHLLVAPAIRTPRGTDWFTGAVLDLRRGRTRSGAPAGPDDVPWVSGACFAASAERLLDVGGFGREYFLYWEDVDLSVRWARSGGRLSLRDDLTCVHDPGGTQDGTARAGDGRATSRGKSPLYHYYNTRNRLLFASRHVARDDWGGWLRATPAHTREVLLRGGRRAVVRHPLRTLWPALRGTAAGLRYLAAVRRAAQGTGSATASGTVPAAGPGTIMPATTDRKGLMDGAR